MNFSWYWLVHIWVRTSYVFHYLQMNIEWRLILQYHPQVETADPCNNFLSFSHRFHIKEISVPGILWMLWGGHLSFLVSFSVWFLPCVTSSDVKQSKARSSNMHETLDTMKMYLDVSEGVCSMDIFTFPTCVSLSITPNVQDLILLTLNTITFSLQHHQPRNPEQTLWAGDFGSAI